MTKTKQNFNQALEELSILVEEMDNPDADLEQLMEKFKRGNKLYQDLKTRLEKVSTEFEELIKKMEGSQNDIE